MFVFKALKGWPGVRGLEAELAAITCSQAMVEFALDGTILRVNENYLNTMGFAAKDMIGKRC
jgi:methyl-accepting chemotaxis protein